MVSGRRKALLGLWKKALFLEHFPLGLVVGTWKKKRMGNDLNVLFHGLFSFHFFSFTFPLFSVTKLRVKASGCYSKRMFVSSESLMNLALEMYMYVKENSDV